MFRSFVRAKEYVVCIQEIHVSRWSTATCPLISAVEDNVSIKILQLHESSTTHVCFVNALNCLQRLPIQIKVGVISNNQVRAIRSSARNAVKLVHVLLDIRSGNSSTTISYTAVELVTPESPGSTIDSADCAGSGKICNQL